MKSKFYEIMLSSRWFGHEAQIEVSRFHPSEREREWSEREFTLIACQFARQINGASSWLSDKCSNSKSQSSFSLIWRFESVGQHEEAPLLAVHIGRGRHRQPAILAENQLGWGQGAFGRWRFCIWRLGHPICGMWSKQERHFSPRNVEEHFIRFCGCRANAKLRRIFPPWRSSWPRLLGQCGGQRRRKGLPPGLGLERSPPNWTAGALPGIHI